MTSLYKSLIPPFSVFQEFFPKFALYQNIAPCPFPANKDLELPVQYLKKFMILISRKKCFKPTNELMNKCMGRLSCNCRILLISQRFINPAKLNNQLAFTHSPIQNLSLHMHLPFYTKSFTTFLRQNQFQNFVTLVAKPSFIYTHPKLIEVTFSFPEFLSTCRKTVYSIFCF